MEMQAQQAIADAKNEYIPIGGAMIAADMYIPDPNDKNKAAKRVRIPYQALDWLVKQLETQGQTLEKLESQNKGSLAEMAQMIQQPGPDSMAQNQSIESQMMARQQANQPIGVSR